MTNRLPTTCPACESSDTGQKYQGDETVLQCRTCGAFWYWADSERRTCRVFDSHRQLVKAYAPNTKPINEEDQHETNHTSSTRR